MDDVVVAVAAAVLYEPRFEPLFPDTDEIRPYLRSAKNEASCGNIRDIVDWVYGTVARFLYSRVNRPFIGEIVKQPRVYFLGSGSI